MRRKLILCAAVLPLLGALGFFGPSLVAFLPRLGSSHNGPPVLECPETLDLGEQERGQIASERFRSRIEADKPLKSRTSAPVVLAQAWNLKRTEVWFVSRR